MNKRDVMEIKRRFKKEDCTFTRMCGCYVDGEKNRVVEFGETFLNLEDEEFYKYLELAKKALSGTIGNHLLELEFPLAEEAVGGRQQFLMALRDSSLKNDELLERFYDLVIENYDFTGNYLILIFHDAYDVISRTSDNDKLDESEEVYEYLLCAICPVTLTKPGLGYREDENRIGPRIRDWVVGAPESGFIFPAFTDRSSDIHAVMCYNKNPKDTHVELMEGALGCDAKRTAAEQKQAFEAIVKNAFGGDEDASREVFYEIQQNMNEQIEDVDDERNDEPVRLTSDAISDIMVKSGVPESAAAMIEESYSQEFKDEAPILEHLIDPKVIESGEKLKKEKELVEKVGVLEQQLKDTRLLTGTADGEEDAPDGGVKTYDVILRVKPEKATQIKSQMIDGHKCLIIPMDDNEHAAINGVNTTV